MIRTLLLAALCLASAHVCLAGEAKKKKVPSVVPGAIHGKIYAIDTKLNLVMINVGEKQGVKPLMTFLVLRDDGLVGYIKVSTVLPDASGALIDKLRTVRDLKIGDRVIKQISRPVKKR